MKSPEKKTPPPAPGGIKKKAPPAAPTTIKKGRKFGSVVGDLLSVYICVCLFNVCVSLCSLFLTFFLFT